MPALELSVVLEEEKRHPRQPEGAGSASPVGPWEPISQRSHKQHPSRLLLTMSCLLLHAALAHPKPYNATPPGGRPLCSCTPNPRWRGMQLALAASSAHLTCQSLQRHQRAIGSPLRFPSLGCVPDLSLPGSFLPWHPHGSRRCCARTPQHYNGRPEAHNA